MTVFVLFIASEHVMACHFFSKSLIFKLNTDE